MAVRKRWPRVWLGSLPSRTMSSPGGGCPVPAHLALEGEHGAFDFERGHLGVEAAKSGLDGPPALSLALGGGYI